MRAEDLRLLVRPAVRPPRSAGLKPFALVIEDDPDNLNVLSEALRLSGMRVLGCRSGSEGIALALELAPDCPGRLPPARSHRRRSLSTAQKRSLHGFDAHHRGHRGA